MKKILLAMLTLLTVVSLPIGALARYNYVSSASSNLSISGSTATVTGYVSMSKDAEEIDITTRLLLDGEEIESWSTPTSQTSTSRTIRKSVRLTERGTYQVETEYTVYGPSGEDHDYVYSKEVDY